MPIQYRCEHCQQLMSIATRMAGREVPCAKCGRLGQVPEPEAAAPPPLAVSAEPPAFEEVPAEPPPPEPRVAAPVPQAAVSAPPQPAERKDPKSSGVRRPPEPVDDDADEPPIQFRRKKRDDEELDMTPLVDVTFLLLIFFMVTASFGRQKTLLFPPPEPEKKGVQTVQQVENVLDASIRIGIDARNVVSIEDDRIADLADLPTQLREKMRLELKFEALVSADPRALHDTVVRVVDACNEAGFQKIRLSSRSEPN